MLDSLLKAAQSAESHISAEHQSLLAQERHDIAYAKEHNELLTDNHWVSRYDAQDRLRVARALVKAFQEITNEQSTSKRS